MKQYNVNGMSCAACSTRVEKAVSKVCLLYTSDAADEENLV